MDTGITAAVGDSSWPHLRNQANPWLAQTTSAADNGTIDGAPCPAVRMVFNQQQPALVPAIRLKIGLPWCDAMSTGRRLDIATRKGYLTVSHRLISDGNCSPPAGFYILPRSPTEVYFDVSTEALEARLYNQIYCCDTTNDPTCAGGCAPGKPFATPSTWADILNREALRVSRLMFSLRPEGHMFHQVNMHCLAVLVSHMWALLCQHDLPLPCGTLCSCSATQCSM